MTDRRYEIILPGLFTGVQVLVAFCEASRFEEPPNRLWAPVVNGHEGMDLEGENEVVVKLHRLIRASWYQRSRFGKKDRYGGSLPLIGIELIARPGNAVGDTLMRIKCSESYTSVWIKFRVGYGRIDDSGMYQQFTNDMDHPGFASYRAAYDQIVRGFLDRLTRGLRSKG